MRLNGDCLQDGAIQTRLVWLPPVALLCTQAIDMRRF